MLIFLFLSFSIQEKTVKQVKSYSQKDKSKFKIVQDPKLDDKFQINEMLVNEFENEEIYQERTFSQIQNLIEISKKLRENDSFDLENLLFKNSKFSKKNKLDTNEKNRNIGDIPLVQKCKFIKKIF
jgi:hypothetical protein